MRSRSHNSVTFVLLALVSVLLSASLTIDLRANAKADEAKIEELYQTSALWQVGTNVEKVAKAREELRKFGLDAIKMVYWKHFDTSNSLETRAIDELYKGLPDLSVPFMLKVYPKEKRYYARWNLIRLLGEMEVKDARTLLIATLKDRNLPSQDTEGRLTRILLVSVSLLVPPDEAEVMSDVGLVASYLKGDELTKIAAAQSLGNYGVNAAIPLLGALTDELFSVRYAAAFSLEKNWESSVETIVEAALAAKLYLAGQNEKATLGKDGIELRNYSRYRVIIVLGHLITSLGEITKTIDAKSKDEKTITEEIEKIRAVEERIGAALGEFVNFDDVAIRFVTYRAVSYVPRSREITFAIVSRLEKENNPYLRAYLKDIIESSENVFSVTGGPSK